MHHFYGERFANKMNARMFREMQLADYVCFQSEYAKKATEELMGKYEGASEILYNSIDSSRFVPISNKANGCDGVTLLMAGSHKRSLSIAVRDRNLRAGSETRW